MCGRYYVEDTETEELRRIMARLGIRDPGADTPELGSDTAPAAAKTSVVQHTSDTAAPLASDRGNTSDAAAFQPFSHRRDIVPGSPAPMIAGSSGTLLLTRCTWGYPAVDGKGRLLINARAETALTKPTFREDVRLRRCLLPASGFYEWNAQREKFAFTGEDGPLLLAGFYGMHGTLPRFVILTTAANASMAPVHPRMPLILPVEDAAAWILEDAQTAAFLEKKPALLHCEQEGQLSLNLR